MAPVVTVVVGESEAVPVASAGLTVALLVGDLVLVAFRVRDRVPDEVACTVLVRLVVSESVNVAV